jgi:hypothetical protein
MHPKSKVLSVRNALTFLVVAAALAFAAGCIAPFSDLQSAKMLGKGNYEVTPGYSAYLAEDEGDMNKIQDHFLVQGGYGLSNFLDLRLRYEHASATLMEGDSVTANILAFGPKMRLAKNWLALYVPIGFAFGGDVESSSESWQLHPTLLMTLPIGKFMELNPSAKLMIPLSGAEGLQTLYAFNLGLALSTDVRKWAIRPEVGLCTTFEGDYFLQYSIGLTLGSGLFK